MKTLRIERTVVQERERWRREVLADLRGIVLDIGAGSGPSAHHLAPDVTWLALEPRPSRHLTEAVERRQGSRLLSASAEQLPCDDSSIDAAICSTVLCSVADQDQALAEIRRVLRPKGQLVFFEHVCAAPGSTARRLQGALAPWTRRFDKGCDPCRDTADRINAAGFAEVSMRRIQMSGVIGRVSPYIEGRALR